MDIKNSIVAILDRKKKIIGTGFVAGENLILTCAHVVETATSTGVGPTIDLNIQLTIRFAIDGSEVVAQVDMQNSSPGYEKDVALLRVDALPQGAKPLPLAPAAGSAGHDFYAYGYATVTNVQGIGARGKIVDIVDNGRLVQLNSQEPDRGMSGGPVLDEQRRVVIGMVTKGKNKPGVDGSYKNLNTVFATPFDVISKVCLMLKPTEACPYYGLDTFNEEDAPFFFGRDRVVTKLLESLKREPRFLAVLGPSGSGKSSVVRAGLIPALRQGKVPSSQKWGFVTIRPANDPFEQLAGVGFINPQSGLENAVKTWLADRPDLTRLMLVIDQFEEILVSTPTNIRQKFIVELTQLLNAPVAITLVLTLRDDFYSRFLNDAANLTNWLERGLVNAPPNLEQDELKAIILEPAKSVGLIFDEGLIDVIIADACETDRSKGLARSTILPLLEFALTELWELRHDGRLTHEAYKNVGGTTGSLSQWADRIYYELSPNERKLAEQVFCRLVHLGDKKEEIRDTKRVIPISELAVRHEKDNIERVVQKLVQTRLLSVRREYKTGEQFVEIIHDSLLYEWRLFEEWINNYRYREQKARERRRNLIIISILLGFIVMIGLILVAGNKTVEAANQQVAALTAQANVEKQSVVVRAQELAGESVSLRDKNFQLSLLLGIEAFAKEDIPQSRGTLLDNTRANPFLSQFLGGHAGIVTSVAFSPDGKMLASASGSGRNDDTITLWDTETGRPIGQPLKGHSTPITCVTFSPDGKILASSSRDSIILWNTTTHQPIGLPLKGHSDGVTSVTFSPNGRLLVSSSWDKTVILWNITKSPPTGQSLKEHTAGVNSVAFSPDGKMFASGSDDQTIILWNTETGKPIGQPLIGHTFSITSLAFSPNGKMLASSSLDDNIILWNLNTGQPIGQHIRAKANDIAFSPDGQILASGGVGNTITLWDTSIGQPIGQPFIGHTRNIASIAFSPNGKMIASGSYDKTVILWNLASDQPLIGHTDKVSSVAFSPDGKTLISGSSDKTMIVWDSITGKPIGSSLNQHAARVSSVAFSPDGKLFASGSYDGTIILWDTMTRRPTDLQLGDYSEYISSIAFSPNGETIASGDINGDITLWDITTGQSIGVPLTGHADGISSLAFSPDGKKLASGSYDQTVILWDLISKQLANTKLMQHSHSVTSVAFSPDGKMLASGSWDQTITLWDITTNQPIGKPFRDTSPINTIAFSPPDNGKILVSGNDDGSIRLWDTLTGQSIGQPLTGHTLKVTSLIFSPDGETLASGSEDYTIKLWNIDPQQWVEKTCQRVNRNLTRIEWAQYIGNVLPYEAVCPNLPLEPEPTSIP